ncbi:MAG: hypothetical protein HQK66_13665, partial [Desulfamplus sp.]|nr:hypothetical protein [Desulfamplus sp.]
MDICAKKDKIDSLSWGIRIMMFLTICLFMAAGCGSNEEETPPKVGLPGENQPGALQGEPQPRDALTPLPGE